MASKVQIANLALQRIGSRRIASFTEESREGDAVRDCYDRIRDSELRKNFWTFAITRVQLPADSTAPAFGRAYQYSLPGNCVRIAPDDPSYRAIRREWLLEGRKILSDYSGPLQLRYVRNDVPEEQFDPIFADALAERIAMQICEELTGSTSKLDAAKEAYIYHVAEARRANAIEAGPIEAEEDILVTVRRDEGDGDLLQTRQWGN